MTAIFRWGRAKLRCFPQSSVLPSLDVSKEDICQGGPRKTKAALYAGEVINGDDGDQHCRDLQNGALRSVQLFVAHGHFPSSEISDAMGDHRCPSLFQCSDSGPARWG